MQLISVDKSSKVGQLSHWVRLLKLNDLGNITFCRSVLLSCHLWAQLPETGTEPGSSTIQCSLEALSNENIFIHPPNTRMPAEGSAPFS